jgi:hypothetical protein
VVTLILRPSKPLQPTSGARSIERTRTIKSTARGQIRFRQSGPVVIPGSMPVAGTMTGTAVHIPELFSGSA